MKRILNRIVFLLGVMLVWEIVYRLDVFPDLLFPSVGSIFSALIKGFMEKDLLTKTINSLILIFEGVTLGIIISLVLLCLSIMNKFFFNIINNMLVFLNPIPSIAIFPLCILWFGIGKNALLVVMLHSVVWGLLLNALTGVEAIPKIYREIGMNLELSKFKFIKDIYIPAIMPYVISGIKVSLARAWRTAKRKISEKNGFKVWLCYEHHEGTFGVHGMKGHELDLYLKRLCQLKFEKTKTREEFIKLIGKSLMI